MANISKEIKDAMGVLGKKYEYDVAVLEKEVEAIMASKGMDEKTALREWKKAHKWIAYTKEYEFMAFGLSEPKTIIVNRGTPEEEQKEVSNANIFVKTDEGLKTYVMSFWDENADKINTLSPDLSYTARLSLNKKGYANLIGELKTTKERTIPAMAELIPKIPFMGVDDLKAKNGEFVFFKGEVAEWVDKDGARIAVKIDSLTGFPVTVWLGGIDELDDSVAEVKGFGRVSVRDDGEVMVYSNLLL
jgi:hypothetical protein